MSDQRRVMNFLHVLLRPAFAICLFLSQLLARRNAVFTQSPYLVAFGIVFLLAGVLLLISASRALSEAQRTEEVATGGPFKYVRHPIYASVYLLSIGLGLIFLAWLWFAVLIVFLPLWYLECKEEEKELMERYREEYADYQRRTGMVLPDIFGAGLDKDSI